MGRFSFDIGRYIESLHIPTINPLDVVEICIIALLVYCALVWIKETHAWALLRGVIVIAAFLAIATVLRMNTILWIARQLVSLAVIAVIVILQPELRKALEGLGQRNILPRFSLLTHFVR